MRRRCQNLNSDQFHNYGARGIFVCPEWEDFSVFKEWALENGYRDDLELDRIDNDGPYCPSNCRYVSRKQNANNIRRNKRFLHKGQMLTPSQLADIAGVPYHTMLFRLTEMGIDAESAVDLPKDKFLVRKLRHGY